MQYAQEMERREANHVNVAPDLMIHPLYVELQKASPMGMMRDYEI